MAKNNKRSSEGRQTLETGGREERCSSDSGWDYQRATNQGRRDFSASLSEWGGSERNSNTVHLADRAAATAAACKQNLTR